MRRSRLLLGSFLVGPVLMVAGVAAFVEAGHTRLGPATAHAQEPQSIIAKEPFENAIPGIANLPVPSKVETRGLKVKMPELGISLDIVEGDGINAPLYKAAHYPGTSWPGDGGRTVLYAHARSGMFGPLFNAKVGQKIQIAHPNGSVQTYKITEYYPSWPITDIRWLRPGDYEELVLVTCTTYDPNDPRIVVVARPA